MQEVATHCLKCEQKLSDRMPILKWAGSKRWAINMLEPFWHNHRINIGGKKARLVEPFAGSLALTLALNPKHALLNDANYHLINFYRWIQLEGLIQPLEVQNTEIDYYRLRREFNELIGNPISYDSADAAYLFYYLNQTGYRGLCRFNLKGQFNVPYGNYATRHYYPDFKPYQKLFKNWQFKSVDFERIKTTENDFVYLDPPYDSTFTDYISGGFTWADQERLANWAASLPGTVVVSNSATERVLDLYKSLDFTVKTVSAPRKMDAKTVQSSAIEMIAGRNLL